MKYLTTVFIDIIKHNILPQNLSDAKIQYSPVIKNNNYISS